jgi:predicted enzyme related to lactoylglutathione lyase
MTAVHTWVCLGIARASRIAVVRSCGLAALAGLLNGCGGDPSASSSAPIASAMLPGNSPQAPAAASGPNASTASGAGSNAQGPGPMSGAGRGGDAKPSAAPIAGAGVPGSALPTGEGGSSAPATQGCPPREVSGEATLRLHHVHFNSSDPGADIEFYVKYFGVTAIDFCADTASAAPTRAVKTDRAYLLFTRVDTAPDPALNTYLEHVGWSNQNPTMELRRQMMLGIKLWPQGGFRQCPEVEQGQVCDNNYYFTEAPNGARIEVSMIPGPSTSGFAHMHLNGGFPDFFRQVLGDALQTTAGTTHVGGVNLTNVGREAVMPEGAVDTRGKPIDHLGFSTGDIEATLMRIEAAGLQIAEPLSLKPEYGFRSFMVKSPQGVWLEIVEDAPFM